MGRFIVGLIVGGIIGASVWAFTYRIEYGSGIENNRRSAAFALNVDRISDAIVQARKGSIVEVGARSLVRRSEISEICLAGPYGAPADAINQRSTMGDTIAHIVAGEPQGIYWVYDILRREAEIEGDQRCRDLTATLIFKTCVHLNAVCIGFSDDTPTLRSADARK